MTLMEPKDLSSSRPGTDPVHLIQITDPHLGAEVGSTLLGLDTDHSLNHVIALIKEERGQPDLLLATGDLSNDGSVASYRRFHQLTRSIAPRALWLPGNHDDYAPMGEAIAGGPELSRTLVLGNWQVVMLNSAIPGKVGGGFSDQELGFLQHTLAEKSTEHTLVCLHHQPVDIGCDWLDQQRVANASAFFSILDRFDHVRGLLWGHIHQQVDRQRNGVQLMASPSSCIQFAPNSPGFKLDRAKPGYRWLELYADGRIETGVSRVTIEFDIDYDSAEGY